MELTSNIIQTFTNGQHAKSGANIASKFVLNMGRQTSIDVVLFRCTIEKQNFIKVATGH